MGLLFVAYRGFVLAPLFASFGGRPDSVFIVININAIDVRCSLIINNFVSMKVNKQFNSNHHLQYIRYTDICVPWFCLLY